MRAKSLLIAVSCINLLACLSAALGDGGVFIRRKTYTNADVLQPTQKVYIRWDGSQERLLIQTKYQGPAEEMVWIVPVPAEPTVEKGDSKVFDTLGLQTFHAGYFCDSNKRHIAVSLDRRRGGRWRRPQPGRMAPEDRRI